MGDETAEAAVPVPARSRYRQFVDDLDTWVKILAGVVVIVGAVAAWFLRPGPSPVESYREKLQTEVCLGDLKAAVEAGQFANYAGSGGAIDKQAWLSGMSTVRTHVVNARNGLQDLAPPKDLRDEWQASLTALDGFIRHWDQYRSYTSGVPARQLTVFDYPNGIWKARNAQASTALSVPLGKLMGKPCGAPTATTTPPS